MKELPTDLKFVLDEITEEDPLRVGILFHMEIDGKFFPKSNGVSFYKISPDSRKLIFARTVVEPPVKAGFSTFPLLNALSNLVRAGVAF
mmetsp:Transcript_29368/g.46091  ORF Transcript_29368/g.46091 Transcript_29368/m.46091 type:complete len:89 (+) Transcript_29368:1015-1281(+)|eukprot:CAMPEP_0184311498 /NCGR_PEP_ID=MMETSP1049-20130417/41953_1 /TAXON_ID=77928 /ORGANISM="Proteomonas sulcata, Strain CCMP704" /LENGTH=88 /DNA_ID=CAMNT_0026626919 /DNA_START=1009 /DNA_END=1275 /DNA_ORIENTATION=-